MISLITNWLFSYFTVTVLVLFFTIFYYYATSTHGTWRKLNVPYVEPLPLFGNIFKLLLTTEHQTETYDKIYRRFPDKKYCGFYQMRTPYLMIRDPELINNILIKDFTHFTDHGFHSHPEVNMLASSLFFMNGQRWRIMRQKLSPGFTSGKLKLMHDQIKECSKELMNYINEKSKITEQLDMNDIMAKYATDVIGTCAFGLKLDTVKNDDSDFRNYGKKLFNPSIGSMLTQMVSLISPKLVRALKLKEISPEVTEFYKSAFSEVIKYREDNNVYRNDVAQTLMHARNELVLNNDINAEEKFTDADIIANAVLMFLAGSEPTSVTLAFCLHELALNPHIQNKLRKHIYETKEKHGGEFNNDFLMSLHYADMVLTETLRKCTGTVVLFREATQKYHVPNDSLVIEKGQKILIPMYSIHHDPKYYPNPDIFDPERFSPEEKAKRPSGTQLSFGDGPRLCLGKRFAELEIKLVLSELLSKFEIVPCEKTENPVKLQNRFGTPILPLNGVWLKLNPIEN